MTKHIRLAWNNPNPPSDADAHTLNFDAFTVWQFLELAALVSDTHFVFNADGSVTIAAPDVIVLPDDTPRPVYPVPGSFDHSPAA